MSYETKNIRNIALLGHGNNGKTSLAESMLYVTGAIDRLGKVADGNTVCDYDAEEIARQITIATSIAPVSYDGCKINVLDCPGFFDFVGDALCALRAVEAGMIVTSAKDTGESIPVGAQRCWNYLKAASLPVMFTISKCNEEHGDYFKALETLKGKYGSIVCPVTIPTSDGTGVIDLVHNVAYITKGNKTEKGAVPAADADHVEELRAELMEAAAGATEELMEKFFETMELEEADIQTLDYSEYAHDILILHGTKDEVVPFEAGKRFAGRSNIEFIPVEGADHRFQNPACMEAATKKVIEFFGFC